MAQSTASDQHIFAPDTLFDVPEQPLASNPDPLVAASALAPMAAPTTINGGTFGSGPDTLVLTLAEDAFKGDAQASIAIDGKTLTAQPITVTALKNAGRSETFTFKSAFGSGAHDLAVSFLNDAYGGTPITDRNLYVNGASFNGTSARPTTAELDTAGTTRFTIPPATDPEAAVGMADAAPNATSAIHLIMPTLAGN